MTTNNTHPIELALIGALAVLWAVLELSKALVALCLLLAGWRAPGAPPAVPLSVPLPAPAPSGRNRASRPSVESPAPVLAPVSLKPKRAPRTRKAKPTPTPVAA